MGTAADTAVYYVYLVATEGSYADTAGFYIYDYDSYICGNIDHLGGINVIDLNWLVGYLFKAGPPPVTLMAGDLNCSTAVSVSDLTYLVNFLFKGGPSLCSNCPLARSNRGSIGRLRVHRGLLLCLRVRNSSRQIRMERESSTQSRA